MRTLKNILLRPVMLLLIVPFLALGLAPVNLNNHLALSAVKKHLSGGWTTASGYSNIALNGVSCPDAADCVAAGSYGVAGVGGPSIVTMTNGTVGALSYYQDPTNSNIGSFSDVSCSSVGNCTAVGDTYNSSGSFQPAYAVETNGVWGSVMQLGAP